MALFDKLKSNKILTPEERREKTIEQLKKQGITYNPHLPLLPSGDKVNLKSPEEVKKRALACMLSIQLACSIRNGEDYSQSLAFVLGHANDWKLSIDDFLPKERSLIQNKYTQNNSTVEISGQNVIDVVWEYEAYWALIWAIDLISDKELVNATKICNTERAMAISVLIDTITTRLRSVERILDKLDLFYCYHWACVEQSLRPETKIGKLNHEVVMERRKGLEWLISEKKDWDEISLST